MSVEATAGLKLIGARVRSSREERSIGSLEDLADRLATTGCARPSVAKLSRIETGIQPVPTDILPALAEVTGIPASELRPDLARMFPHTAEAAE